MQKILLLFLVLSGPPYAQPQVTYQFSIYPTGAEEVPPNNSYNESSPGSAILSGTTLSYNFGLLVDDPWALNHGTINGPAGLGVTAPMLFDLGAPSELIINPPPALWAFAGAISNLNCIQIEELVAGLWYVNVFPETNAPFPPGGEYRGQIRASGPPTKQAILAEPAYHSGQFQFTVCQVSNVAYVVQATTDLSTTNWTSLATNVAPFTFIDLARTNPPSSFYRALPLP